MNSLPGPDKGLFDVLFGSKTAESAMPQQAVVPGEQAVSVEDFMKMLANAQDQTAPATQSKPQSQPQAQTPAQTQVAQPKGGSPENLKSSTAQMPMTPEQAALPQLAQPAPKAQSKAKPQATVASAVSEEKSEQTQSVKPKKQAAAKPGPSAEQQAQAAAMAAAQVQPQAPQAMPAVGGNTGKPVKHDARKPVAQTQSAAQASGESKHDISSMQQQALMQAAPKKASEVKASAVETVASAPSATVIQPIIIQVPMAVPMPVPMPFEVMEASESEPQNVAGPVSKPIVSSQEFLANRRGSVLGVDRADPRLQSRVSEEKSNHSDGGLSEFALLMPQVRHSEAGVSGSIRSDNASSMISAHSAKVDVSNPMAIASQVQGLMARGGGTVKVRIAPENLGEMTISVQNRGRQLDVKIEAGSKEAREALLGAVPELRQALSSGRYEVGSIEVARPAMASETLSVGSAGMSSAPINLHNAGFGMMNQERSFADQNQQQQQQGSAWDRYNDQQESGQKNGQGRQQQSGYRRYQEHALGA